MAAVNLPDDVYQSLQTRAERHGLSIEQQAAQDLKHAAEEDLAEEALLQEIRTARGARAGLFMTEKELQHAKRRGRA